MQNYNKYNGRPVAPVIAAVAAPASGRSQLPPPPPLPVALMSPECEPAVAVSSAFGSPIPHSQSPQQRIYANAVPATAVGFPPQVGSFTKKPLNKC